MDAYNIIDRKFKSIEKINDFLIEKEYSNRCTLTGVRQNTLTDTFGCKYGYSYRTFFFVDYMEKIK